MYIKDQTEQSWPPDFDTYVLCHRSTDCRVRGLTEGEIRHLFIAIFFSSRILSRARSKKVKQTMAIHCSHLLVYRDSVRVIRVEDRKKQLSCLYVHTFEPCKSFVLA